MKLAAASLVAVAALATPAHADSGDRWNAGTMGLQAVGGVVGLTIGAGVGGLLGAGIGSKLGNANDWGTPLLGALIGGTLLGVTGLVVGVDLVGDDRNSTGSALATLGGVVVSAAGFVALTYAHPHSSVERFALYTAVTLVLIAPPVIAYQLSADAHAPASTARIAPLVQLRF